MASPATATQVGVQAALVRLQDSVKNVVAQVRVPPKVSSGAECRIEDLYRKRTICIGISPLCRILLPSTNPPR